MSEIKDCLYLRCGDEYHYKAPSLILGLKEFTKMRCPNCGSDDLSVRFDDFDTLSGIIRARNIYRCNKCNTADYLSNVGHVEKEECKSCGEPPKEYFVQECKDLNKENHELRKLVKILLDKVE